MSTPHPRPAPTPPRPVVTAVVRRRPRWTADPRAQVTDR